MKVKTSGLIGPALDWAVAKCESIDPEWVGFSMWHQNWVMKLNFQRSYCEPI